VHNANQFGARNFSRAVILPLLYRVQCRTQYDQLVWSRSILIKADPVGQGSVTIRLVQRLPTRKDIPSNTNHLESEPEFDFQKGCSEEEVDEDDEVVE